jgi:hypothetical protein
MSDMPALVLMPLKALVLACRGGMLPEAVVLDDVALSISRATPCVNGG